MLLLILTKFVFSDAKIIRMSKINKQPGRYLSCTTTSS